MSNEYDQHTDFAAKLEELLKQFHGHICGIAHESTEISNERIAALQAEIDHAPKGSIEQGKLGVIGVSYQTDVKAIALLRDLCTDLGLTIGKLNSLQSTRAMAVQSMQAHLESVEAGNGGTLQRSAGTKLH